MAFTGAPLIASWQGLSSTRLSSSFTVVSQFVTDPGVAQGLTAKLNAIASALAQGNENAKAGIVGAFINQVRAQTGKSITAEDAAILIRLVSAL